MRPAAAILCERCGYELTDLEPRLQGQPDAPCPECGEPIARSLPERRTGSAWQRRPGPAAWLATHARTLARPRARWREVRAHQRSGVALALLTCAAVALAWGLVVAASHAQPHRPGGIVRGLTTGAGAALAVAATLPVLCWIERVGLRLYARRRGWRTTGHVAWAVIGHASVGWALAPVAAAVLASLTRHYINAAPRSWSGPTFLEVWLALFALGPLIVGMLAFETLVYIGWRSMRFANHPRA